ncbi:MAG: DHH family phosphoesterase [Candidatus Pacearchaeota archaeon]|nr:MAG: DHH family phosphoesterase [Candidatus Pacearchaeota archaeon]
MNLVSSIEKNIKRASEKFKKIFPKEGIIRIVTHLDTDGLTSAAILTMVLIKNGQEFWITIVKQLEESIFENLKQEASKQKWKALLFLDLGSGNLGEIKKITKEPIFIIDHHEIEASFESYIEEENFYFINPLSEKISAAGLCYLFAKGLGSEKKLAQFAVLGMIGDILDKSIGKLNNLILNDAKDSGMKVKRGLTVFSAMRPLHKALEFSSSVYIPGVTGNFNGSLGMLREIGINAKKARRWRTLMDLNDEEVSRLITAILVRRVNDGRGQDIIDNIYLIKIANQIWDAREVSTMLNACGRLNYGGLALSFLLGSREAREEVENVYSQYKHLIIKALNWIEGAKKIQGSNYIIVNARSNIKDTIIGTAMSILSSSFIYSKGTILIGMAYRPDSKIKISARIVRDGEKKCDVNLNKILSPVIKAIGGEVGGHPRAAGALISQDKEKVFLELIEKEMNAHELSIKI